MHIACDEGANLNLSVFSLFFLGVLSVIAGIEEVKSRLVVAPPKYIIKVIDKDGIRVLAEV